MEIFSNLRVTKGNYTRGWMNVQYAIRLIVQKWEYTCVPPIPVLVFLLSAVFIDFAAPLKDLSCGPAL